MTILSNKFILKRLLVGIEEINPNCIQKLNSKFKINGDLEKLAEAIIKNDTNNKFFPSVYKNGVFTRDKIDDKKIEYFKKFKNDEKKFASDMDKLPIFIDNFDINSLQGANYDLRLGKDYYVTTDKYSQDLEKSGDTIVIEPGEFGILTTHEYIYIPDDLFGMISLKYKYKKLGLINISGFHVDPGYCGIIIFSVFNSGPKNIVLRYKEPVFMIIFDKLIEPVFEGYSPNKSFKNIPVDIIQGLKGPSVNLISLDERLKKLENQLRITEILLVGFLVAIAGYFIEKLV